MKFLTATHPNTSSCRPAMRGSSCRPSNAGSVFVGDWSPESGGDYATGTNHVLPTYGCAAAYSSLGLADFTKRMTVQEMTPQGFSELGEAIAILAHAEQLDAHRNAVLVRLEKLSKKIGG